MLPKLLSTKPRPRSSSSFFYQSHHADHRTPQEISAVHRLIASSPDLPSAQSLFDEMPQRTCVSHNSIISAHCRLGHVHDAWVLVSRMMAENLRPNAFTFGPILSSPSLDLTRGAQLHSLLVKLGLLRSDPYTSTALVGFFCKNRKLVDALKLFEEMTHTTVVTWSCVISGFSQLGFTEDCIFLFRELLRSPIILSECSFLSILSSFRSPESWCVLEQVHGLVIKMAMECYTVVSNSLLHAYSNCFASDAAEKLFNYLPTRDLVSWNTKIAAYAKSNTPEKALDLFCELLSEGLSPNESTFVSVIGACFGVYSSVYGEFVHAKAMKYGFSSSVFVGSSLVDFYAKCKSMEDARIIFDGMPFKNIVTWNALISGYSNKGSSAVLLFVKEMLYSELRPNEFTFSSVVRSATVLEVGQLHSLIIRMGYSHSDYVSSALMVSYDAHDMMSNALACSPSPVSPFHIVPCNVLASIYNRVGRFQYAKEILFQIQDPDAISWNILITACARNGNYLEAFRLLKSMQTAGYLLDNYTVVSLLSICAKTSSLELGSSLHGLIVKMNAGSSEIFVGNLLMDMYAKCGNVQGCLRIFAEMRRRNLISWTTLISGLGLHGCAHEALKRFRQMESDGLKPDGVAFIAVLSACRHGGFVEEGMLLFKQMKCVHRIEPEMDHYVILVDLLSRFGHLKEAEQVISGMPFEPNAVIWRTFLQGCRRYP